ncbi:Cro/Cl family transcriptional regulator [Pseudomonas plecoglossicida]|uniref:Cro/CI family transcriptional regulator n=1 Tax=Pseudomonas plecoglossicida TaxID=70775 RepID=UPI0015E48FEA|nr:Cro/CI family transcriptional regulator [Pseudomonas plecoglossicida]MBA1195765.1 Cro/Cl family transcriptional regulator [Pseudomonas plecoglossicida]
MSSIQLKDFARERGQPEAAMLLGVTQGALSKAIRVGRNISVIPNPDGSFSAEETRPFPSRTDSVGRPEPSPTLNENIRTFSPPGQSAIGAVNPSSIQQAAT